MVILHAFLALAAGFATMAVLVTILTALLKRLVPSWTDEARNIPPAYAFVNLGCSFLAGAAGGYITASLAAANPLFHSLALGIVVLALAALSALQARGRQPVWYLLALIAISPVGVVAGGLMRLRVMGIQ